MAVASWSGPLDGILASGQPDFPFCVCWANESWTRTWDSLTKNILVEQRYSPEDDVEHMLHLVPMLEDARYIRIEGKPLVLVYRVEILPDARGTADRWRAEARKAGVGEISWSA